MDSNITFADNFADYLMDAQYLLNPQEVRNIDKDVRRVIYRKSVAQKIFPTEQIPRGRKEHRVSISQAPSSPVFSMDFLPESMDKIAKAESIFYLTGISKDYFLSMVDIDGSRNSEYHRDKIDTLHLREMTAIVADFKERLLWRGQDILGANPDVINANVQGIVNTTGINTFTGNALGTAGDGPTAQADAVGSLVVDKYIPPFDCVMTPYIFAQLAKNFNSTTHITDLERMAGQVDIVTGAKMVKKFYISDHLIKAADNGTASAWAYCANKNQADEDTYRILESYPLWHYPITTNKLGIQGKVLWMGGVAGIRADAVSFEDAVDVDG